MKLTSKEFKNLFREKSHADHALTSLKAYIKKFNFEYSQLPECKEKNIILKIIKQVDNRTFDRSGLHKLSKWEDGWSENYRAFVNSRYDTKKLKPLYYKKSKLSRFNGHFIKTKSLDFQYNFFQVLRHYIVKKYLNCFDHIYEFGCGPGHNICAIDSILRKSHIKYYGLDWTDASVKIVNKISSTLNINAEGRKFNFLDPDKSFQIEKNSALITFGGLEQIGPSHTKFIKFIISKKPSLCINVEPLFELYNQNCLIDYIACRYHESRGYLKDYLSTLTSLKNKNLIKIVKVVRVPFGGIYHEGWSFVVWRPL